MFSYVKSLQYPVKIRNTNPALAKFIISQYGGPDGELAASLRYLSQRYSMPTPELRGLLTDIGVEELGHFEMVASIIHQLTRDMTPEEIKKAGFDTYYVDHTAGVYPQFASGTPWTAATIGVKGDTITDLTEDMGAEQKARTTYDNILRLSDDPDVNNVIKFLREREVVHFQRFGEANLTKLSGFYRKAPAVKPVLFRMICQYLAINSAGVKAVTRLPLKSRTFRVMIKSALIRSAAAD